MKLVIAALAPLALLAAPAAGADSLCLKLSQIDESPVVSDTTILLKMKNGDFHRVDLAGRCPSLKMSGFAHQTPSDDFCTSTVLTVMSPSKSPCTIERIVKIERAEADQLMAKR